MRIMDDRYGGEIISPTGKIFTFDSIDCMRNFLKTNSESAARVFVLDFESPGNLIPVQAARFVHLPAHFGPMGTGLVAYSSASAKHLADATSTLTWAQVLSEQ